MKRTPLKRSTRPIKKVNRKRKASEFVRCYGSKARVEWVKSLPCVACEVVGYSENAHIETGGMGRKADARFVVPLCGRRPGIFTVVDGCHNDLHRFGRERFETSWRIDLSRLAALTARQWEESQ